MRAEHWIYTVPLRLRSIFRRRQANVDLDEELRDHMERKIAEDVSRGVDPEAARRAALLELGGLAQVTERCREARRVNWLQNAHQDVLFALRSMRRNPGFAATAILTLTLGSAANTAVFSVVDSFLLRPLPVSNPGQIMVFGIKQGDDPVINRFSVPEIRDLRAQTQDVFSGVVGYQLGMEGLAENGSAQTTLVDFVTGNFFSLLGVQPYLGRLIGTREGEIPGADPVLVIGYDYWKSHFSGDPGIIGRKVAIDGVPITVVGIAPKGFHGVSSLVDAQVYLPLGMLTVTDWWSDHDFVTKRAVRNTALLGRLRPGVDLKQAQDKLSVIADRWMRDFPIDEKAIAVSAYPERLSRPELDPTGKTLKIVLLFFILSALVLALACTNVTALLLVRLTARQSEMAVRSALGANRNRLVRQMFTETMILMLTGAVGGLLIGYCGCRMLRLLHLRDRLPIALDISFDWRLFAYTFAAVVITGILTGAVPALRASDKNLIQALRESGRTLADGHHRLRGVLVSAEIGGSLLLLVVTGFFTRSLVNAQRSDLGFEPRGLLNMTLNPHALGYGEVRGIAFDRAVLERVRSLPGVESASLAQNVPMSYVGTNDDVQVPGYVVPPGEPLQLAWDNVVSAGYFETLKIPIVVGRGFTDADDAKAPPVAVISQKMASRFWPGSDPIGRTFTYGSSAPATVRVIGIARDSRFRTITGPIAPYFYIPLPQAYSSLVTLQVRTRQDPGALTREITEAVDAVAPGIPITGIQTMPQALDTMRGLLVFQFGSYIAASLGTLGMILSLVGLYGVVAYSASMRTHELGIRLALGARRVQILAMILRQGITLVFAGIAGGVVASVAVVRTLSAYLIGVRPNDPSTYVLASLALAAIALLACFIPARRAMLVQPMASLRQE